MNPAAQHVLQRVDIWVRHEVEPPKISAGLPAPIRFLHHVKWAGTGRSRALNDVFLLQLLELHLWGRQLLAVQFPNFGSDGLPMCDMVDNVMAERR